MIKRIFTRCSHNKCVDFPMNQRRIRNITTTTKTLYQSNGDNKFYDSQSGKHLSVTDASRIRLHDFTFQGSLDESMNDSRILHFLELLEQPDFKASSMGISQQCYFGVLHALHEKASKNDAGLEKIKEEMEAKRVLGGENICSLIVPGYSPIKEMYQYNITPLGAIVNIHNFPSLSVNPIASIMNSDIHPLDRFASKLYTMEEAVPFIRECKQNNKIVQVKLHTYIINEEINQPNSYSKCLQRDVSVIGTLADENVDQIFIVPVINKSVLSFMNDESTKYQDIMTELIEESFNLDTEGASIRERLGIQAGIETCKLALDLGVTRLATVNCKILESLELIDDKQLNDEYFLFQESAHQLVVDICEKRIVYEKLVPDLEDEMMAAAIKASQEKASSSDNKK